MTELNCKHLPFVIDVVGRFPPDCVRTVAVDTPRSTSPTLETLIAAEWDRRMAEAQAAGRILFNGPMLRYVSHKIVTAAHGGDEFHLTVGPTCYRDFVGTNLFNHHRLGEFAWHSFSNPIGTTATLITSDNLIVYGVRSWRVSYHASHVHTFGGCFEERDRTADGQVDPFGSLSRELVEELNIRRDEMHDFVCVGLIRDKEIHQPEMLFEARLELTADELLARWETAEAKDEHDSLVTLVNEPGAIVPFIQSCGLIAPVAIGALFLHGKLTWGDGWFRNMAEALESK